MDQKALRNKYFYLYDLECGEKIPILSGVAISVFDHWLSEDESTDMLINNSIEEVGQRVEKHRSFSQFLVGNYSCLTYKFKGKLNHRIAVFKKFTSLESAKSIVDPEVKNLCNRYKFSLVIPELNALYFEGSDYTNYLYSDSFDGLSVLLNKAKELGLYSLPLE